MVFYKNKVLSDFFKVSDPFILSIGVRLFDYEDLGDFLMIVMTLLEV